MECIKNQVGVTRTECECELEGLTPEEIERIRESKSGVYLDQAEGALSMRQIGIIDDCTNFAKTALLALSDAESRLISDLKTVISDKHKPAKTMFTGAIGKTSYTQALMKADKRYQFVRLDTATLPADGVMEIFDVRLIVSEDIDTTVKLISLVIDTGEIKELASVDVSMQAKRFASVGIKAEGLDLSNKHGQAISYFFVWDNINNPAARPMDVKTSCSTCGESGYTQYIIVSGGEADTDYIEGYKGSDKFMHGFSINAQIKCEGIRLVCREFQNDDAVSETIPYAIMYKANELLIERLRASTEINRYTLMSSEALLGKRNFFKKQYELRIQYLADRLQVDTSDCYICRQNGIRVQTILS